MIIPLHACSTHCIHVCSVQYIFWVMYIYSYSLLKFTGYLWVMYIFSYSLLKFTGYLLVMYTYSYSLLRFTGLAVTELVSFLF